MIADFVLSLFLLCQQIYETTKRVNQKRTLTIYPNGSPLLKWAIAPEIKVIPKPTYTHSLTFDGTCGIRRMKTPKVFAMPSSTRKY